MVIARGHLHFLKINTMHYIATLTAICLPWPAGGVSARIYNEVFIQEGGGQNNNNGAPPGTGHAQGSSSSDDDMSQTIEISDSDSED